MGFATALSGLKAASANLQVTGNNIANSQTIGFKESRAEFADVYASSIGGVSKTQPGSGVKVTEVAQQFNQGNIENTQNSLDLAVSGNGFFVLADKVNLPDPNNPNAAVDPSVPSAYTRNGAFQLNSAGNVVNDKGQFLLAFAPNGTTAAEGFSVGVFRPLTIDTAQGLPKPTENINMKLNINGAASPPTTLPFAPTNPLSYNNTTSITTYDVQGNAHIASTYYVKTPVANVWDAYLFLDDFGITTGGQAVPPASLATVPSTVVGLNQPGLPVKMSFTASGLIDEVGTRAAKVVSAAILVAANTAKTNMDAAKVAAAATAGGGYSVANAAAAVTAANTAKASADALVTLISNSVNANAATAATYATAKADAITAAAAAAAYVASAALVVDGATGTTADGLAATAQTNVNTAQGSATAYNNAVIAAASAATKQTKVDFGNISLSLIDPNIQVNPMAFDIDFFGTTQFATPFSVNGLDQDGLPAGNLTGIDVDDKGVVFARFSNGGSKALGQVALARFQSNQSLAKLGDTTWATTSSSGAPIYGAAGDNNFGGIQSSALEGSNVDLSDQLVRLIIAQQAYQANSQTITTEKTLIQTILNA